eukprot:4213388-Ditylum_brightwellii.AAC.1
MLLSAINESVDNALDSFGSIMILMLLLALFVGDNSGLRYHRVPFFKGHDLFCLQFLDAFDH